MRIGRAPDRPSRKLVARAATAILALGLLAPPAAAAPPEPDDRGSLPHVSPGPKRPLRLDGQLDLVARTEASSGPGAARRTARDSGLDVRDGLVRVDVLTSPDGTDAAVQRVMALGGEVPSAAEGILEAWVPPGGLEVLARSDGVRFIRTPVEPVPQAVAGQGVGASRANLWHAAGFTGAGVEVAVIDVGFAGYTTRQAQGDLPPSVTTVNYCPSFTGDDHGTAVAEIVHEMAPGAQLYLICVDTVADLVLAENYADIVGVTVVNHSVVYFNTSRGDGSGGAGTPDATVQEALADGIVWANAMGNYQQRHWSGNFSDGDTDLWHNFAGTDETNSLTLGAGGTLCVALKWDSWPTSSQDYDVYLYRAADSAQVDASLGAQTGSQPPTESFCYTNPGVTQQFGVSIRKFSAILAPRFDLFTYISGSPLQYQVAASSLVEPASAPEAIGVGAICWENSALESYSSQGPTIDGRIKPEVSGFAKVSSGTSGNYLGACVGGFAGTSAASPHVAGAAALWRQQFPGLSPPFIRIGLESHAIDLGPPGKDNLFGAGRLRVLPPQPDLRVKAAKDAGHIGDGVYEADPTTQVRRARLRPGRSTSFEAVLQNDGFVAGTLILTGTRGNVRFKVRYVLNGQNVTAQMTGGGAPILLPTGGEAVLSIVVRATNRSSGKRRLFEIQAVVQDGADLVDAVGARVRSPRGA